MSWGQQLSFGKKCNKLKFFGPVAKKPDWLTEALLPEKCSGAILLYPPEGEGDVFVIRRDLARKAQRYLKTLGGDFGSRLSTQVDLTSIREQLGATWEEVTGKFIVDMSNLYRQAQKIFEQKGVRRAKRRREEYRAGRWAELFGIRAFVFERGSRKRRRRK